jgi:TRAP-type C4-dicarboxylate transport system substrate-binding protein
LVRRPRRLKRDAMMKRFVLTALLLACAGLVDAATLKLATVTPEGSDWMKQMRAGAAEIEDRTGGRVQIKFYGGGVQGNDAKVLGKIRIGALQGGAFTPTALGSQYPDINLYGMPMVFESEAQAAWVRERMDAKLQEGMEDAGFVSFGFAAGGFAAIMSAVTLPLTDVLTGLQTGLIDIVGISPIGALVLQWHTKVKYMTELPLSYTIGFLAIDKKAFDKLDPADREVVRDVMTRIYRQFDEQNLIDNRAAREALLKQKIQLVEFDAGEYERLRGLVLDSNRALGKEGAFSIDLYDEMLALAAQYRETHAASADAVDRSD